MEELKEKANSYAEENVNNVLKEAFAKVYADGYRDGYKDCEEKIPVDLQGNKTEFIDLCLPSGTLWAADYEKDDDKIIFVPHCDVKNYSIPSTEQWEELVNVCEWEYDQYGSFTVANCIGLNGNILKFYLTGLIHVDKILDDGQVFFWLSDEEEGVYKNAVRIYDYDRNGYKYTGKEIKSIFFVYKLPVRLVKSK